MITPTSALPQPNPAPLPPADLSSEIAALIAAGCSLEFAPHRTQLGTVETDVLIKPPPITAPRTIHDEFDAASAGHPAAKPIKTRAHLPYEARALASQLREARLFLGLH
jgi:hypothetical protein